MRCRFLIGFALFALSACQRPLVAHADPTGTERLPLRGTPNQTAVLTRDVQTEAGRFAAGTRLQIWETWLLRKEAQAKPPGYRITGHYDPASQSEEFVLPRGTIHVYWYGPALDGTPNPVPVAIPQDAARVVSDASASSENLPSPARPAE